MEEMLRLAIILSIVIIDGCAATPTCVRWEALPTAIECTDYGTGLLDPDGRLVCVARRVCKRCIEIEERVFEPTWRKPWNACEDPQD